MDEESEGIYYYNTATGETQWDHPGPGDSSEGVYEGDSVESLLEDCRKFLRREFPPRLQLVLEVLEDPSRARERNTLKVLAAANSLLQEVAEVQLGLGSVVSILSDVVGDPGKISAARNGPAAGRGINPRPPLTPPPMSVLKKYAEETAAGSVDKRSSTSTSTSGAAAEQASGRRASAAGAAHGSAPSQDAQQRPPLVRKARATPGSTPARSRSRDKVGGTALSGGAKPSSQGHGTNSNGSGSVAGSGGTRAPLPRGGAAASTTTAGTDRPTPPWALDKNSHTNGADSTGRSPLQRRGGRVASAGGDAAATKPTVPSVLDGEPVSCDILEEQVGSVIKFRAVLQIGSTRCQGPVRWERSLATEDLDKLIAAMSSGGLQAVQEVQPELFRIRERRRG